MKKSRNGFINNLRYLCLMCVVAVGLMTIGTGCGGGGGGEGGGGEGLSAPSGPRLRDLAENHGILIGTCVGYAPLLNESNYANTLKNEFSMLTPENQMKWDTIHPQLNAYNFTKADYQIDFAENNGMAVHGHTLVWHSQNPDWLTSGLFTREQLIGILRDHIHTVVDRYKGRVTVWDVVNEGVADDGTMRDTLWRKTIGDDYIDLAFQFASEADPDAKLIYNDYGGNAINMKSDAIYNLVQGLLSRGVPIHGIGFQMHLTADGMDYHSLSDNIRRFADLGLDVYITELDVMIQAPVTEAKLADQADVYWNVLDRCLSEPACKAFQMWGFTDKHSWIPGWFPGYDAALIFDEDYNPKPAYYALQERLM